MIENYKRNIATGAGMVLLAAAPCLVLAEADTTTTGSAATDSSSARADVEVRTNMPLRGPTNRMIPRPPGTVRGPGDREDGREDIRDMRRDMMKDIRATRASTTAEIEMMRRDLQRVLPGLPPGERIEKIQEFHREAQGQRAQMHKQVQEERDDFRVHTKERFEAMKKKIGEERAKHVEEAFGHMIKRMEDAIDRLGDLATRIGNRLDVIAVAGKDVSSQQTALTAARLKITDAQSAVVSAKLAYDAMASSTSPKDSFPLVRTATENANKKIKYAHKALTDVVKSIKEGRLEASVGVSATTTATTTTP